MEEILASIRRILNDDDVPAAPVQAAEEPAAEDDVLVLDDSMMVSTPEPGPDADHSISAPDDAEPGAEPEAESGAEADEPVARDAVAAPLENGSAGQETVAVTVPSYVDRGKPAVSMQDLWAPEAAAAAASSVGSLVRTLAAGRATRVYGGGPTLEDMVRAELRPLLKEWLDANLPPMVERLVRAEIERVVVRGVP
jgi:uncharacterized protein